MGMMHWIGILVAAVAGFVVGGLWYGPLFGKAWMAARGISKDDTGGMNMPLIFGTTFLLNLVAAFGLAHIVGHAGMPGGLHHALLISGAIALFFIVTSIGVNYLFSRMSLKLFLIDSGYWVVIYCVMGAVLGLIH